MSTASPPHVTTACHRCHDNVVQQRLTTDYSLTDEWNGVQRLIQVAGAGGVALFPKAANVYLSTCIVGKPACHHICCGICSVVSYSQDVGGVSQRAWVLSGGRLLP